MGTRLKIARRGGSRIGFGTIRIILPFDNTLEFIAYESSFWTYI